MGNIMCKYVCMCVYVNEERNFKEYKLLLRVCVYTPLCYMSDA